MKTIITSILTAIVFFFNSNPSKAETTLRLSAAADHTVSQYINAITKGQVDHVSNLFDNTFIQNVTSQGKVSKFTKKQVVTFLKANENIEQQKCVASYRVIEASGNLAIARVEVKYPDFTKVDYVTLCRDGLNWKVNQITTVYP